MCVFLFIQEALVLWNDSLLRIWTAAAFSTRAIRTGLIFAILELFLSKSWFNSWDPHDEWTQGVLDVRSRSPWAQITVLFLLASIMATPVVFLVGKTSTLTILPTHWGQGLYFNYSPSYHHSRWPSLSNLVFKTKERRVFSALERKRVR